MSFLGLGRRLGALGAVTLIAVLLGATAALTAPGPAAAQPGMVDPAPRGAEYVSLGDSFVANGGLELGPHPTCRQASDGVGNLVAARLPDVSFGNWACGSADTDDITRPGPLGPQLNGLSAGTRYISISIGGNDHGLFRETLTACVLEQTCTAAVRAEADRKLDQLPARLDRAFAAIIRASPHARVVATGYLRLVPDQADGCFLGGTMGQAGFDFANRVQRRLNEAVAGAAERAGFEMVNQWQDGSNSVCAPDGRRHISATGIGPGDNGIPFHPTRLGREYVADLVVDALLGGQPA